MLHTITARFCLRSYYSAIWLPFFKHLSRDYEKTTITAMYHGRWWNNTECVGKKRFNGRELPTGFGKSMCYVPPFGQGTTTFFVLIVICNSLNLLLKSLPINIIKCIKFYGHWIFSFQHILYYFLLLCFDL
jgi:hypothetical protein